MIPFTEIKETIGFSITEGGHKRINSTAQILQLFDGKVENVYLNHDAPAKRGHLLNNMIPNPSSFVTIFSIKK